MKKFVSLAAALTLVLAMSLNVCAAPSVSKLPTATTASGAAVTVRNTSSQYTLQASSELAAVAGISEEEANSYSAAATMDVHSNEAGDVTLNIVGIKAGDSVIVLHKCSIHGWEKLPATVSNGAVTATFHNFSPVVVFVKAGAASPKTADAGVTTAAIIAVIAIAGLVASKKKFA